MHITELKTRADFAPVHRLVKQQNPNLSKTEFNRRLKAMLTQGYRCIAAIEKEEYQGICGFWRGTRFWCGDFIDVDNVIVDGKHQGKGIGKKMMDWVEKEAKKQNCQQLGLDCYVTSHKAHRFYLRENFVIKGYHMIKPLIEK